MGKKVTARRRRAPGQIHELLDRQGGMFFALSAEMNDSTEPPTGTPELQLLRPRIRLPFIQELRHYSRDKFRHDLVSGATLTLVSIPQP